MDDFQRIIAARQALIYACRLLGDLGPDHADDLVRTGETLNHLDALIDAHQADIDAANAAHYDGSVEARDPVGPAHRHPKDRHRKDR